MVPLAQNPSSIAFSDDRQSQSDFSSKRIVLLLREDSEELPEELESEIVISNEESPTELEKIEKEIGLGDRMSACSAATKT